MNIPTAGRAALCATTSRSWSQRRSVAIANGEQDALIDVFGFVCFQLVRFPVKTRVDITTSAHPFLLLTTPLSFSLSCVPYLLSSDVDVAQDCRQCDDMALRSDFNHEDHLRRLLDQRAARADLHGRFPSTSDFSDSPSVYSHAHFSPRPVDRADHDARTSSHIYSTAHRRIPSDSRTDRQRLNIPEASSLDMDDEHDASYPPSIFPADEDNAVEDTSDEVNDTQKVAYGPKMTVHSRAPWETGEEDNENHDEQDSVSAKKSVLYFSRKDNSKKSRGREHRQDGSRPSVDSIRSQSRSKQSIESSSHLSVGGALMYVNLIMNPLLPIR